MEGKKLIFASQGTVQNKDSSALLRPCCEALKDSNKYLVISADDKETLKGYDIYNHIDIRGEVPYSSIMSKTDIFITNGGYGGVNLALKYGVPIIVAGRSDDKGEVGARVERSGVGINLRTSRPTAKKIKNAINKILNDDRFNKKALEIRQKIISNDSAKNARCHIDDFFAKLG